MDAAVARLSGGRAYCSQILGLSTPCLDADESQLGMRVTKSGRSSGCTEGLIDGVHLSTVITFPHGPQLFEDQLHIVPRPSGGGPEKETSAPGDSGALWVNDGHGHAVALHFGGDIIGSGESEHSLASPIKPVLDALEVSLRPSLWTAEAGASANRTRRDPSELPSAADHHPAWRR